MDRDGILVDLVATVNAGGAGATLTLLVGGALVTGTLASADQFMAANPDLPRLTPSNPSDPHAIHLTEATLNGQHVGWVRLLIAHVDAFSMQPSTA